MDLSCDFSPLPCESGHGENQGNGKLPENRSSTEGKNQKGGKSSALVISYYFDSRQYNTMNIQTSKDDLPLGIHFWGFTDIHSDQNKASDRFDFTRYFMEYRLGGSIGEKELPSLQGVGWEVEFNDFNGPDNHVVRFGLTYRHGVSWLLDEKSWIQWRIHPYQTDEKATQASLIFRFNLSERIFISGFADINLVRNGTNRWVAEPQLNYVINDTLDLIIEGRINQFEGAVAGMSGSGVATGIKVKF